MALIKTKEEIEILKEAGRRLSRILGEIAKAVKPGIRTIELDDLAERLILEGGDIPILKNYQPEGARIPFPASLCVSINDEVVHGIPDETVLEEGDIVGLDICLSHKGLIVDMAMTVPVGEISDIDRKLVDDTKKALNKAVSVVKAGNTLGDIGHAVESFARPLGYGVVEALGGHGVGHAVHEPPYIANLGKKGQGEKLVAGMVLAIEPMLNLGTPDVKLDRDDYTFSTRDKKKSAHFEVTLAVTENGADILTPQPRIEK